MNTAIVLYASNTGNTKRVAVAFIRELSRYGWQVKSHRIGSDWQAKDIDVMNCDLLCVGSPVQWSLPSPDLVELLRTPVIESTRIIPGPKCGVAFATYGGAHLGPREADACLTYLEILFEHLGFQSLNHLAIPGKTGNTLNPQYYHPDLHNRPDQSDLVRVAAFVDELHQKPELMALMSKNTGFNQTGEKNEITI